MDFVIKKGLHPLGLIQVCIDLSDPKTRERERRGQISAMNHFNLQEGTIITSDHFDVEKTAGMTINYEPIWYLLLKNSLSVTKSPAL